MKAGPSYFLGLFLALLVLATAAPLLIRLSYALLPLVVVVAVAVVVLRLVFFHTRRW